MIDWFRIIELVPHGIIDFAVESYTVRNINYWWEIGRKCRVEVPVEVHDSSGSEREGTIALLLVRYLGIGVISY